MVAILLRMHGGLIMKLKTSGMFCIPKIPPSRKHGWMLSQEKGSGYKMMQFQVSINYIMCNVLEVQDSLFVEYSS